MSLLGTVAEGWPPKLAGIVTGRLLWKLWEENKALEAGGAGRCLLRATHLDDKVGRVAGTRGGSW